MKKKLLYIGNNLKDANPTALVQLVKLLNNNGFFVEIYSNKKNKFFRLIDIIVGFIKNLNADFILIDTYSTTNFYVALTISQVARSFKIKYIPILHGGNLPFRLKQNPLLCKLIFKNAHINVSPSAFLVSEFSQYHLNTKVIPNSIEISDYHTKFREKPTPNLLWVRAFDKIYNPKMAIDVLLLLKKIYKDATLCMVGPNKDGSLDECISYSKKIGIFESITFTGKLSKVAWIEKSAFYDIFINTTTIDNSPVSLLEAMALGFPIVSTDVGGIPYLINNEQDGILVPSKNSEQMAAQIIRLLENKELAFKLSHNARLKAQEFDSKEVVNKWLEILEK